MSSRLEMGAGTAKMIAVSPGSSYAASTEWVLHVGCGANEHRGLGACRLILFVSLLRDFS